MRGCGPPPPSPRVSDGRSAVDSDDARLIEIAARLSVLPPDAFVTARTAAAAETGDRALAAAVKKLRKPVLAAWVVNVLASTDADALAPATALADEFREAVDAGDGAALARLTARRRDILRQLVAAAMDAASRHDVEVGPAARGGVEKTLDAALRDPDAAAAVATARLLRPIEASGMEPPDLDGAVSGPFDPVAAAPAPTDDLADRRAKREAARAAAEARRHAESAERELRRVEEEWRAAQQRLADLEERIAALDLERERLEADADRARDDVEDLGSRRTSARQDASQARKAADRAEP